MMVCGVFSVLFGAVQIFVLCFAVYFSAGATFTSLLLRSDLVPMILSAGISFEKTLNMLRLFLPVVFEDVECLVAVHFLYGFHRVCMCDDVSKPQSSVDIRLNCIGIILYVCF